MRTASVIGRWLPVLALAMLPAAIAAAAPATPTHFTVPGLLTVADGPALPYENGFFLVPENRGNPQSRLIAVRYLRFPAQTATPVPTPVVMLPGGPGSLIAEAAIRGRPTEVWMIRHVTRTRDFIVLQQRGVQDSVHAADLAYRIKALPLDRVATAQDQRERWREGVRAGLDHWTALGLDLRGYTVLEMVADMEDLRRLLGLQRFIVYGTSFGSQWGLSYLKLHQDRVERAVLTGVEPLNHAYDSPDDIWRALQRISTRAAASPALMPALAGTDLTAIYQRVAQRLEREPRRVSITDPDTRQPVDVVLGAEDLQQAFSPVPGSLRDNVEAWPRFLLELDRGDYRYLAVLAHASRQTGDDGLLEFLVDNSLGITAGRDARLRREPAARWLGDINAGYMNTRDMVPTADVGDDFRADFDLRVPVLMIQGDTDLSTPLENAQSQQPHLKNGRLVVVEGGTHQVRLEVMTPDLMQTATAFENALLEFIAPTTAEPAATALQRFPARIALAPFRFQPLQDTSMYEQWLRGKAAD